MHSTLALFMHHSPHLAIVLGLGLLLFPLTSIDGLAGVAQADGPRAGRVSFVVNGRSVPEQTFQATLRRLVRAPSPRVSERIVNEDGSHGGHGKTYDARDPNSGERWIYMEVTLRNRAGQSRMSRVLRRARR